MKKLGYLAMATAASFALASAAQAADFIDISGSSGVFGKNGVSGTFEETFSFDVDNRFRLGSFDISSIASGSASNVDFTSVTFNGVEFNILSTGRQEFRNLFDQAILAGNNTIVVRGTSGSNGAFSGTISLAAIPEPATWAMMVGGFGVIGASMRRRARVKIAYA